MSTFPSLGGTLLICASLALTACKPRKSPNWEATLSLPPDSPGLALTTLATELKNRAALLEIPLKINPSESSNGRLTIRFHASDKKDALKRIDKLCENGRISIRAIHDRSAYLTDLILKEPSQFPPDYEILTHEVISGDYRKREKLAVARAEILNNSHVEGARAERGKEHMVHISLNTSGLGIIKAASEKMQKGRSRLAIIYDERIISAPVVTQELWTPVTLEGFNSFEEAEGLATSLNKPLSAQLLIESLMPLAP